jgi:hypothetical protein
MAAQPTFEFNLARGADWISGTPPIASRTESVKATKRVSFMTTQSTRYSVRQTLAPGISGVRRPLSINAKAVVPIWKSA